GARRERIPSVAPVFATQPLLRQSKDRRAPGLVEMGVPVGRLEVLEVGLRLRVLHDERGEIDPSPGFSRLGGKKLPVEGDPELPVLRSCKLRELEVASV